MTPLKIIQIHYHTRPGGVTDVISQLRRVFDSLHIENEIWIGTGSRFDTDAIRVIPELNYLDPNSPQAESVAENLFRLLEGSQPKNDRPILFWIHNHHLGKNCALTEAVWRLCQKENAPGILLHIHDFPEERPDNLLKLSNWGKQRNLPKGTCTIPRAIQLHMSA